MSSQPENEKRPRLSSLGAQGLFKRSKDHDKDKNKEEGGREKGQNHEKPKDKAGDVKQGEPNAEKELEQGAKRKRPSSWRFSFPGAMFSRTQSQYSTSSERGLPKQSSFGGRIEKKAALSTILSALSKKQSQEKEVQDNSREKISRQVSLPTRWSSPAGTGMPARPQQRRPMSELIEKSSSIFESPPRQRPASSSYDPSRASTNTNTLQKSDVIHENPAPKSGAPFSYGHSKLHTSDSDPVSYPSKAAPLASRRVDAPRSLSESVVPSTEGVSNDVVLVSPSYISRKRLSSGSDSVTVSTAFQVQGQPTATRTGPNCSDPWSSSVSVCVPFQVTEDQEVRALPLSASPTRSRPVGSNFSALNAAWPGDSSPLPEGDTLRRTEPAPAKPNPPSPKESILSRDLRQAPKRSEKGAPETRESSSKDDGPAINGSVVKKAATLNSQPPDVPDGVRKADETDGGPGAKTRSQFIATKPVHAGDDDSANRKAAKDVKKPNKSGAKAKPDKEQASKAPTEVTTKQRARTLPFHRDTLQSSNKGSVEKLSPKNTPKARSVNSSPKFFRSHDSKSRNAAKPSASDPKDHAKRGRPQSDPLIGDKLASAASNKKGSPLLSQVGKIQAVDKTADEVNLKSKLRHCEEEKSEIQEKVKAMELQLSVLSLLEKEKLQLQRRLNDMTQELDKTKSDLTSLKASAETNNQEKKAMESRHEKLLVEFEKSQGDLEETRDKKELLEEEKNHLLEENEKNLKEFDIYLDKIEKLTNENATRILEQGRLRGKLSTVEESLGALKDCATKMKQENLSLRASVVDFRSLLGCSISDCVKEFEPVVERLKNTRKADNEDSVMISEESNEQRSEAASVDRDKEALLEELEINKRCVQTLLGRINQLENENSEHEDGKNAQTEKLDKENEDAVDYGAALASVWEECCELRERLQTLQVSYDSQTRRLEELENEKEELKEEKKSLEFETKYLKNVLSYREDTQKVQVDHKTNKQMQRMESDLGVAENKVKGLEGEVDRLQAEKQALLQNILNLNAEQARQAEEDLDEDEDDDDDDESRDSDADDSSESLESETESGEEEGEASSEKGGRRKHRARKLRKSGDANSTDNDSKASRRERYNFRRALSSMSTESEYSVYSLRDEDDDDSSLETEGEEGTQRLKELVKRLKEENRLLQSRMDEVNGEREEVLQQFEKLCDDYDFLESRLDKLEEGNKDCSEQFKSEKRALKAQVKDLEKAKERLEESLKEVQDEKHALLKCLEMRNSEGEESSDQSSLPLPMSTVEEIIARAQAFSQEEKKERDAKREESSVEESSSEEEDKEKAQAPPRRLHVEKEQRTAPEGRPDATPRVERDDELASIVASIETDLGKLKEKLYRNTNVVDGKPQVRVRKERSESLPAPSLSKTLGLTPESEPEKLESEPEKTESEAEKSTGDVPSSAERFLTRQASSVKVNLERVYREKQHLEGEVEQLRQCFTRSLRRGSVATVQRKQSVVGRKKSVVAMADNQVEAIRTLQELLQRADSELKESNAKISRLEEKNAEADEKLKESELLQSDLRQAVVISHNYASEENERAETALEERQRLMEKIARLQRENDHFKQGFTAPAPSSQGQRRGKGTRAMSDDSSYLAESESAFTQDEGESDFFSSRHSSMASESDLLRSPPSEGAEDPEEWPKKPEDGNENSVESGTSPSAERTGDSDEESTSRTSSTFSATE